MKRLAVLLVLFLLIALVLFLFLSFDITTTPHFSAEAAFCPSHKLFSLRIGVPPALKALGNGIRSAFGVVWNSLPLYLSHPFQMASSAASSLLKEANRALFADLHICAGIRS